MAVDDMYFRTDSLPLSDSSALLRRMKGSRILGLRKILECDPESYLRDFSRLSRNELFAFGPGPVLVSLENDLCLGFGDDPRQSSVVVWEEKAPLLVDDTREPAPNWSVVDCTDQLLSSTRWAELIGDRIERLAILKVSSGDRFRNERGLWFRSRGGREWMFSFHMRRAGPGDFLIMDKDEIAPELVGNLAHIEV